MGLKDILIEPYYRSKSDESVFLNKFLIPALGEASVYKRAAGYFSLCGLSLSIDGLIPILKAGGEIKIICSPKLNEFDIQKLSEAYKNEDREKIVTDCLLREYEKENHNDANRINLLISLIANGDIGLKIAYKPGILYHEKFGYIEDNMGDFVTYIGSLNETYSALTSNIETIQVTKSWTGVDDPEYLLRLFNKMWKDDSLDVEMRVIDFPTALQEKIVEKYEVETTDKALEKYENIKKNYDLTITHKKEKKLYEYQEKALNEFFENDGRHFLEMATGTGKTFTSIKIIEESFKKYSTLVVILTHQKDLQIQWFNELKENDICTAIMFGGHGDASKFDYNIEVAISGFYEGDNIAMVCTYDTFFDKIVDRVKDVEENLFIVVDEAHNISANQYNILPNACYRLGLSATPEKHDQNLMLKIIDYFIGSIRSTYKYTLEDAIDNCFLSRYEYHIIPVHLTEEEIQKYNSHTRKIIAYLNQKIPDLEKAEHEAMLRSLVVKKAKNKRNVLRNMLESNEYDFTKSVIYCGVGKDNNDLGVSYIDSITMLLNEYGCKSQQYTSISQNRKEILEYFKNGFYDCLAALRCLDEGVDIPQLERIYIMSSEKSIRQTVQRRGRVLRKCLESGKTLGYIYDFVVFPPELEWGDTSGSSLIANEFLRVREYTRLAENKEDLLLDIENIELTYGLVWDEEEKGYGKDYEQVVD